MQEAAAGRKQVSVMFAEATGSFLFSWRLPENRRSSRSSGSMSDRYPRGADGATSSDEVPLGLIGAPAALLQVAEGADLR